MHMLGNTRSRETMRMLSENKTKDKQIKSTFVHALTSFTDHIHTEYLRLTLPYIYIILKASLIIPNSISHMTYQKQTY